jgi:hypothetical protein
MKNNEQHNNFVSKDEVDTTGDYKAYWENLGHKCGTLIRRTKDYIVHISEETNRLDWATTAAYDKALETSNNYNSNRRSSIMANVAALEARPCSDFPEQIQKDFRILLGEALVCCFDNDYDAADLLLREARSYITARSQELSRYWYVVSCLLTTLPFGIYTCIFWLCRKQIQPFLGHSLFWLLLAISAGAIGGLFSVLLRRGNLNFDSASGRYVHNIEGCSRVITGAISGGLAALALRSGVLLTPIVNTENSSSLLLLLSLIAGSGERFASSMIEKFDTNQQERQEK